MDRTIKFWGHKNFEIEAYHISDEDTWIDVEFKLDPLGGRDHAGMRLYVCLGRFQFGIQVYDDRHWNYDKHRWFEPGEEQQQFEEEEND